MTRIGRVVLAALALAAGLTADRIGAPASAFACSCVATGPERIRTFEDDPSIIVFVGTVVSMDRGGDEFGHTRGELLIQRLFKGSIPSARLPVIGGGGGDCTMTLAAGQSMVTAARFADGVVTPGLCMPFGDPATPEGQRLILEATAAYGAGVAPPGLPPDSQSSPPTPDRGDRGQALAIAMVGALGIAVVLFGGLILLTRRTPRGKDR
jgi:hypothetical protein